MLGLPRNSWISGKSREDEERPLQPTPRSRTERSRFSRIAPVLVLGLGHLILLAFGWTFVAVLLNHEYYQIALPDAAARVALNNPRGATYLASLAATVLSLLSSWLFARAVRMILATALIEKPVYLHRFGFLVTLSNFRLFFDTKYPAWAFIALVVLLAAHTTTSGWTALLNPTLILLPKYITGSELNISSPAFYELLDSQSIYATESENSITNTEIGALELLGVATLAGQSAAGSDLGFPSFFNFNGASYNLSTAGVLPMIPEYIAAHTQATGWGLSYSGGQVPLNTVVETRIEGFQMNYTVRQQGLTASVVCIQTSNGTIGGEYQPITSPYGTFIGTAGYRYWITAVNCSSAGNGEEAIRSRQTGYITQTFNTGVDACLGEGIGDGFMPIIPCPQQTLTQGNNNSFAIKMAGLCKYSAINSTICQVTPLVTDTVVTYNGGIISQQYIVDSWLLGEVNPSAMAFLVGLVDWIGQTAQGMVSNDVGDSVNTILSSLPNMNGTSANVTLINGVMANYWRGVIEFGGTFLRSGFSAAGDLPTNMTSPISGHAYVLTMGWSKGWSPRAAIIIVFAMIPQTIVSLLTLVILIRSGGDSLGFRPGFDPTDIADALLATSASNTASGGFLPRERELVMNQKKVDLHIGDDGRMAMTLSENQVLVGSKERFGLGGD
ncbi:hypothetical protein CONPUDRAFT_170125 [Coniophora puteana RWD-64-598 SS2]|uniref:Uncharacterized protein n=1 Tax=Coniophora puteana (strain RWD-64-598) TaxID=741705 RepID=R7SF72_CONPW|nr:uncharacterized protein CONPUDRAFT_170125 [Coniophora puteana RWD-64-598 SS2]EIW74397.1 hypothetical protein CONPUDRAFT_170125 [Coniophora puteana RWD-64-598 SS2]